MFCNVVLTIYGNTPANALVCIVNVTTMTIVPSAQKICKIKIVIDPFEPDFK